MRIDNLDALRVLVATAETGSLTSAGRRCGLSTAAVSAALKRLETALGVCLLERTTRRVRLTAEGETMVDHARRAFDLMAQGQAMVRAENQGLVGTVRVTVAAALAHELMAHWLAAFLDAHPRLKIDLVVSDALTDLVHEGVDLALRNGPLADSSHRARLLVQARRVACASPSYLERHGVPADPAELPGHECLVYRSRGRPRDQWVFEPGAGTSAQPVRVRVGGRLSCDDAAIAHAWAVAGRGVLYQSELALDAALASGALVRLFPQHLGEPAPLYAVMPGHRFEPTRVSALVDALAASFAARGLPTSSQAGVVDAALPTG